MIYLDYEYWDGGKTVIVPGSDKDWTYEVYYEHYYYVQDETNPSEDTELITLITTITRFY